MDAGAAAALDRRRARRGPRPAARGGRGAHCRDSRPNPHAHHSTLTLTLTPTPNPHKVLIAATLLSFLPPQSDERKQLTTTVATAT
eukprot:scaffold26423_cov35-Phaeocystis_antarctica.AAC.2